VLRTFTVSARAVDQAMSVAGGHTNHVDVVPLGVAVR
jgi:hypothetical protein